MRTFYFLSFILLLSSCNNTAQKDSGTAKETKAASEKSSAPVQTAGQSSGDSVTTPQHFKKLEEVKGDLDKDGNDELVVVYDTQDTSDFGTEREIQIFQKENNQWKLWHKSRGAVLPSEHGGMMGDPFMEISIANGALVVGNSGGSRDKWSYTHRYRFQNNDWYLIGATIVYGAPCDSWHKYDYNLSTGKIEAEITKEACDEEDESEDAEETTENFSFVKKPASLPKMDGFYPGDNKVQVPGKEESFYY